MTAGELTNIFKQNNIPNDAILKSASVWECGATNMDGVYYNKLKNVVVFTQEISKYNRYYGSNDWIVCKCDKSFNSGAKMESK